MLAVVIDVNVVVSAVMSPLGAPRRVLEAWHAGLIEALTSTGIIDEVAAKLLDPAIGGRLGVTVAEVETVVLLLQTEARLISPVSEPPVTGDPEHDHVLAVVVAGHADYLVTGDKKLLQLGHHGSATIISPRNFLAVLSAPSS